MAQNGSRSFTALGPGQPRRVTFRDGQVVEVVADSEGDDVDRADYSDILAGVREGRFGAETARKMMEVRAHSHQQALKDAHQALDRGHAANYPPDEFAKLFPPSDQSPPDDEDEPGHVALPNNSKVSNQQRASAPVDAEFAHLYPPNSRDEAEARHRAREVAAGKVLDYDDDELYDLLFPGEAR